MAVEKTIQFASMHGFSECHPHSMPYFDTNKGPLSGLVSVELACSGENQLQINMNCRGDRAGNCIVSNPRFWNP